MKEITGGVTAAKGFQAASTAAGIKYKDRKDIVAHAFLSGAGIGNSCIDDNRLCCFAVVYHIVIPFDRSCFYDISRKGSCCLTRNFTVDHCMQLPIDRICNGIDAMVPQLKGDTESGTEASKAIMTTDTKNKEVAVTIELGGKMVTIGGMCKGSGMIHPNMCTMLSFVTTDAAISKELLQEALSADVQDTYKYDFC